MLCFQAGVRSFIVPNVRSSSSSNDRGIQPESVKACGRSLMGRELAGQELSVTEGQSGVKV